MARLDLNDAERDELVRALRRLVDEDRFPLSARVRRLRQILERLEPPPTKAENYPAPKPPAEPSRAIEPAPATMSIPAALRQMLESREQDLLAHPEPDETVAYIVQDTL